MVRLVGFLCLAAMVVAGCSAREAGPQGVTQEVGIHGTQYAPQALTMHERDTLRLENHDDVAHTAMVPGGANTGDIAPSGGSRELRHLPPGTHTFSCKYHASMRLTVTVTAD